MSYRITWSKHARRHFLDLDKPVRQRVAALIGKLAENPRPRDVKAITGMPGVLRVSTGDYRVLYRVDDPGQEVWIEDVRHRSKAYRKRR